MVKLSEQERTYLTSLVEDFNKKISSHFEDITTVSVEKLSAYIQKLKGEVEVEELKKLIASLITSYLNSLKTISSSYKAIDEKFNSFKKDSNISIEKLQVKIKEITTDYISLIDNTVANLTTQFEVNKNEIRTIIDQLKEDITSEEFDKEELYKEFEIRVIDIITKTIKSSIPTIPLATKEKEGLFTYSFLDELYSKIDDLYKKLKNKKNIQSIEPQTNHLYNFGGSGIKRLSDDPEPQLSNNLDLNDFPLTIKCYNKTGTALARGTICLISSSFDNKGSLTKAIADVEANAKGFIVGVFDDTIENDRIGQVVTHGVLTGFSGLTSGAIQYLSPSSSGSLTETKPSSSGEIVRILGYAINSTSIYFNPDNTYIEIA